jgi:hypothetical protein
VIDPSYRDLPVQVSAETDHGNFGFTVRLGKDYAPRGHSVFVFRGADGYDYVVKSNSWQEGGLAIAHDGAAFSGRANVSVIDPATGLALPLAGGNFTYRVDVTDGGPVGPDTYSLNVYRADGTLYHRVGTVGDQLELAGGNVVVHAD